MLLALPYPTMTFLPFYVAEEEGFFERQGVTVRCVHMEGGKERIVQLALEGDVEFFTSISTTVEAILRGWGEVRGICGNCSTSVLCIARPEIRSVADLKGGTVMVGGGRSNNEFLYLCEQNGWRPGEDIHVIHGDAINRINAFQNPDIAAVFARVQYLAWGQQAGFYGLPYPEEGVVWEEGGLATSLETIRKSPELVQKVVNAVVLAIDFLKKDRESAVRVGVKWIPYMGRQGVEGNYDVLKDHFSCEISPKGIDYMARLLGAVKESRRPLTYEEAVDIGFVKRAIQELAR